MLASLFVRKSADTFVSMIGGNDLLTAHEIHPEKRAPGSLTDREMVT
jgi:hypothetical protein